MKCPVNVYIGQIRGRKGVLVLCIAEFYRPSSLKRCLQSLPQSSKTYSHNPGKAGSRAGWRRRPDCSITSAPQDPIPHLILHVMPISLDEVLVTTVLRFVRCEKIHVGVPQLLAHGDLVHPPPSFPRRDLVTGCDITDSKSPGQAMFGSFGYVVEICHICVFQRLFATITRLLRRWPGAPTLGRASSIQEAVSLTAAIQRLIYRVFMVLD